MCALQLLYPQPGLEPKLLRLHGNDNLGVGMGLFASLRAL